MYSIWKFELKDDESQMIEIPNGSEILSVKPQSKQIVVYALVDTEETQKEHKEFRVYCTGRKIPKIITEFTFLDTVAFSNGTYMLHVFYK